MERIREWVRRGLGISPGFRGEAPLDREGCPVVVAIDLLEVSGLDRGERAADVALVPAEWHRRIELVECVVKEARRQPRLVVVVLADPDDSEVVRWYAREARAGQVSQGVRFRVEFG